MEWKTPPVHLNLHFSLFFCLQLINLEAAAGEAQTFARRANEERIPSFSAMKDSNDSSPACGGSKHLSYCNHYCT
jgi:hypothetical protein